MPSLLQRLDAHQRRNRLTGGVIGVVYKFVDDAGTHLAALITYYGFVSLFPLLLLGSTVLGIVLAGSPELRERILEAAVSQLPGLEQDLASPEGLGGGAIGIVVGLLGATYGALGVGQAVQNASNTAWNVPRHRRPNPFLARARSAGLAALIGVDVVGTTVVAGIVGAADFLGPLGSVLVLVGTLVVHCLVFAAVFRLSAAHGPSWREVAPGAAFAAVAWLGLQYVGVAYAGRSAGTTSVTNGVFAVVLGLLAFLYLAGVLVVLAIELNVVLAERLYPRSLLTPFTDDVDLTEADEQTYEEMAKAQQLKGFQRIEVAFERRRGRSRVTPSDADEAPSPRTDPGSTSPTRRR